MTYVLPVCLLAAGVALYFGSGKAAGALLGLAGLIGLLPLLR